jgi:hypothetical protein
MSGIPTPPSLADPARIAVGRKPVERPRIGVVPIIVPDATATPIERTERSRRNYA